MRIILVYLIALLAFDLHGQHQAPCDNNTLQTQVTVDTFVIPDALFLSIETKEKETAKQLDEVENKIKTTLEGLGLDLTKNFVYTDFGSKINSKLFGKDIKQSRKYELQVNSADMAIKVINNLNKINVGRIHITRYKYSDEDALQLALRSKAIIKAQNQAKALTQPIGQQVGRAVKIIDVSGDMVGHFLNSYGRDEMEMEQNRYKAQGKAMDFKKMKFVKSISVNFELK